MAPAFVEQDCKFEVNGKNFEASGASLLPCSDGYWRGVVYVNVEDRKVTTWHGDRLARAEFGTIYQGNFCKMQSVSFTYNGMHFHGRYCPDWSQAVRVKARAV